ncbi:MAG: hypothetical protein ACFFB3_13160 [Candidatus Hodarchaeota archaeon]
MKDGICFNTQEGHLFISLGYIHPPGNVYSVLKYYQKENGQIQRTLLGRGVTDFVDSLPLLIEQHPNYLEYSPVYDCELLCIPSRDITCIYDGLQRYRELSQNPRNKFEKAASNLREILIDLGLPEDSLHLRGSILYARPRPDSDLDLSIIGKKNFATYLELIDQAPGVGVMPSTEINRNVALLAGVCPLPRDELIPHVRRRKTKLVFEGIPVSIKCVRSDTEVRKEIPKFSLIRTTNLGEAIIHGTVLDASSSCCYPVEFEVDALDGNDRRISTILCFESLFAEFLFPGETFEARGVVQEVVVGNDSPVYRLMLGTRELAGKEYLRRINPRSS